MNLKSSRPRTPRAPKTALELIKAAPVLGIQELQALRTPGNFLEFITHWKVTTIQELQELQELSLREERALELFLPSGPVGVVGPEFNTMVKRINVIQGCGVNHTAEIHPPWPHAEFMAGMYLRLDGRMPELHRRTGQTDGAKGMKAKILRGGRNISRQGSDTEARYGYVDIQSR